MDPATRQLIEHLHRAPYQYILAATGGGTQAAAELLNVPRSEEHTSELQSHHDLVCRLLLEKKKKKK